MLEFDLKGISNLRGHESDGLDEGYCELDPQSLTTMREIYGADSQAQAMVDLYERRLLHGRAPNRPRLHAEVLASTLALARMSRPKSVLDLGCGVGLLTRALARESFIKTLHGADIDERHVRVARALLPLGPLPHQPRIDVSRLDITKLDDRRKLQGVDFIAVNEVVQQISDKDWIASAFALKPRIMVVTTPNKDFNVNYPSLLLCENGLRDPEHAFEFTQAEFTEWAKALAERFEYSIDILPLGPADSTHGPASLMAVFQKAPNISSADLRGEGATHARRIVDAAVDPLQYDSNDVKWETEGSPRSPNRRLFLEYLRPALGEMEGKRALDIGCGQGWLGDNIQRFGGSAVGLDPSSRCLEMARDRYPNLELSQATLQEFQTGEQFDAAFMVMVENFLEVSTIFKKVGLLLRPGGQFVSIVADFERSLKGLDHECEYEVVSDEAVAVRIVCPDRFGVLHDVHHPLSSYTKAAEDSGFRLYQHTNIIPRSWHPRFKTHTGKPLFHLLEFAKNDAAALVAA